MKNLKPPLTRFVRKSAYGFTLVEIAVAIFLIALLVGSLLVPLGTQFDQRKISDTQESLELAKEALIGFALKNGYLPCPAVSASNGLEDRTAGVCTGGKRAGFLPWETLAISKTDAWGNLFRYSVTPAYASSASLFSISTAADITIQTRDASEALVNLTNSNSIPAAVLSHGKNGYGATSGSGVVQALPTGWPGSFPDENTNASGTTAFVSRLIQVAGASGAGGEFDDQVAWLSPHILIARMVAAGKLP